MKTKKLVSLILSFCLLCTAGATLLLHLTKKDGDELEFANDLSVSALALDIKSFSNSYDSSKFQISGGFEKIVSQESVGTVLSIDSVNNAYKTNYKLKERINQVGNIDDYVYLDGTIVGSVSHDESSRIKSVNVNGSSYNYDYNQNGQINQFLTNDENYEYEFFGDNLTKITLNGQTYAEYSYNTSNKIITEKFPQLNLMYEHTNSASIEKYYSGENEIVSKINDFLNDQVYTITKSNIINNSKTYTVVTKIEQNGKALNFEYSHFYNNTPYITKISSSDFSMTLNYVNDKLLSKVENGKKYMILYSAEYQPIGLLVEDLTTGAKVQVNFVIDPFGNIIEANYQSISVSTTSASAKLKKIYEQNYNAYGTKIFKNIYNDKLNINFGFKGGLEFDDFSIVVLGNTIYSPVYGGYIQNGGDFDFSPRVFKNDTRKRKAPTFESTEHFLAIEALQNALYLNNETTSTIMLPAVSNGICKEIADIYTLPIAVDEENMLKSPAQAYFLCDYYDTAEVNRLTTLTNNLKKDGFTVLLNQYYASTLGNENLNLQYIFKNRLYTLSYKGNGLYLYKSSAYSDKSQLTADNVISYDNQRYVRYTKSTNSYLQVIDKVSLMTNISSENEINNFMASSGFINPSMGETYNNINFGEMDSVMKNLIKNTAKKNIPSFDEKTEYLTIDDNGNYVVEKIPAGAGPEKVPDYSRILKGVGDLIVGVVMVASGVVTCIVTFGSGTALCVGAIVKGALGIVTGVCGIISAVNGIASIVEGYTGSSWIVENIYNGNIELMDSVTNVAITVGTIAQFVSGFIKTSCFVENTKITTIDGSKNIQDIKQGDLVLSFNTQTNQVEYNKVLQVYENQTDSLCKITTKNTQIISTLSHPYYSNSTFVEAKDLKVGDTLVLDNGKIDIVENIEYIDCNQTKVYNFNVENAHTYFANGVLVHNACADPSTFRTDETDELFKSKEFQDTMKQMKQKYNTDFTDYAQGKKFYNTHRAEFNKVLGSKIRNSTNGKLIGSIDNLSDMVNKGNNPILRVNENGVTKLVRVDYHHLYGKFKAMDLYPMLQNNHRRFHLNENYGRYNPSDWRPFADDVNKLLGG